MILHLNLPYFAKYSICTVLNGHMILRTKIAYSSLSVSLSFLLVKQLAARLPIFLCQCFLDWKLICLCLHKFLYGMDYEMQPRSSFNYCVSTQVLNDTACIKTTGRASCWKKFHTSKPWSKFIYNCTEICLLHLKIGILLLVATLLIFLTRRNLSLKTSFLIFPCFPDFSQLKGILKGTNWENHTMK